jgi:hypothetical protein
VSMVALAFGEFSLLVVEICGANSVFEEDHKMIRFSSG